MRFKKEGKAYQLVIENGNDLADALTLDEALWVAMSAPVSAYTCDPKVLAYLDAQKLGSVTTESLKTAIRWLLDVYADRAAITDHFEGKLPLANLTDSENARKIAHSAKYILHDLNIADQSAISLGQVREFQRILTSRPLNGDGVLSLLATGEASTPELAKELRSFVEDGVKATGGTQDLDGTLGLTLKQFQAFHEAIAPYLAWRKAGRLPEGKTASEILPFGEDTAAVLSLLEQKASRVDEYFRLCELQGFDSRFTGKVLESDGKPGVLESAPWPGVESHLKNMPIVQPNGSGAIPLNQPDYINPLDREWWSQLTAKLLLPVLGADAALLTAADWSKAKGIFGPYRAYMASMQGGICAAVDPAALEHYAGFPGLLEEAAVLEKKDLAVADILKEAGAVEQALLYLQWLVPIANNFISFPALYDPKTPTLFERGRVVIDGRWFHITFPVENLAVHSALATSSGLFLLYVEVDTAPAQILCMPVTRGDKGNLVVGKRGIFFAPDGRTFNAKVVKLIENPICLKEALLAPFAKVGKLAEDRVAAMSSTSEGIVNSGMTGLLNDPKSVAKNVAAPAAKGDKSGMFMGVGIAFAALSSALAFICKTLTSMSGISLLVSFLCVLAVLVVPILALAMIRLRRQDLSSLLEGNGWAINARMRLTCRQRCHFTQNGKFPEDAIGTPRKSHAALFGWILLVFLLVLGAYFGYRCLACHALSHTSPCPAECPAAVESAGASPVISPSPSGN